MRNAEKAGLTTTKPETTVKEMLNAIGESLSDLASSDDVEDGWNDDDDEKCPATGKLSEDDEHGWVMGTMSKTVQHRTERCRQKQMKLDELMQLVRGDTADYFRERDKKFWKIALKVPAIVQPQTADDAASSEPTTFSEPLETLDSVPGEWQMPQATSRPGSSHVRLGSWKPHTHNGIPPPHPPQCPIGHRFSNPSRMNPYASTPAYLVPS